MSWMSYLQTEVPVETVEALRRACERCDDWKSRAEDEPGTYSAVMTAFLAADYVGAGFAGEGLGFVAAAWPDTPDRVVVSMLADRWGNDAALPSDEDYVQTEDLALPLLRIAGMLLGKRLRLVRPPPDRVRPLRGVLAEALRGVTRSHQIWAHPQRKVHGLHPSEQECFWRFIRVAHQVRSVLRPRDVAHHLVAAGFHPEFAQQLAREYQVGRQVLTVYPEPWNLRRVRKERRRTRRANLERELPSSP